MDRFDQPRHGYFEQPEHSYGVAHQDLDHHVKIEVHDFYRGQDPDVFLDQIHNIEAFFSWHDILEGKRLQFPEAKFNDTTRKWWDNYKEDHKHLDVFRNWEDLKAAMKRRFEPPGYRQRTHLHLTKLQQGTSSVKAYTTQFYRLTA